MIYTIGDLFFSVGYVDERLTRLACKRFDDGCTPSFVVAVQSMERLIENQQFRVFDKGPRKEQQPLFTRRDFQEWSLFQVGDMQHLQQFFREKRLLLIAFPV